MDRSEVIPEASATTTAPMAMDITQSSHEQPTEPHFIAQDMTKGGQLGPTPDIVIKEATKVQEPSLAMTAVVGPSNNVHMVDISEEEIVDYEGSSGEKPAKLSSVDDDAWDSTVDIPPKHDTSKFSYLSVEDLKVINPLEVDTPSRGVESNITLLVVWEARHRFL